MADIPKSPQSNNNKLTVVQKLNLLREQYVKLHNHCLKMKAEIERLRARESNPNLTPLTISQQNSAVTSPALSPSLSLSPSPDSSPGPSTPSSPRGHHLTSSSSSANEIARSSSSSSLSTSVSASSPSLNERSEFVTDVMTYVQGLFDKEEMSDVIFQVGGQTIFGHSVVVAARSPFLKQAIKTAATSEINGRRQVLVKIDEDIKFTTFKDLLRYIYTDVIKVGNQEIAKEYLIGGARLQLLKLKNVLERELIKIVAPQNCVSLLNVAVNSQTLELKEVCLKMINQNFERLKERSNRFAELDTRLVGEINHRQSKYPFHLSLRLGRGDVVLFYLKGGEGGENGRTSSNVDVNQGDDNKCTLLRLALLYKDETVAAALVEAGADINTQADDEGEGGEEIIKKRRPGITNNTLLHRFIEEENQAAAIFLIKQKADVNRLNSLKETPLHIAARKGLVEVVPILLENGSLVNSQDNRLQTALHVAVEDINPRKLQVTKTLLNSRRCPNLEIKDENGLTALALSLSNQGETAISVATLLVEQEANINQTTNNEGETLLHRALDQKDEMGALFLISKKADIHRANHQGYTPLHLAVLRDLPKVVEVLLRNSASINALGPNQQTPIHLAVANNNEVMVQLLLNNQTRDNTLDLSIPDDTGSVPLRLALNRRFEKLALMLVEKGASVNVVDKNGRSLLESALEENNDWAGLFLVRNNAPIDSFEKSGRLPLEVAVEHGLVNTVKALLSRGVDVNGINSVGKTSLYQALTKRDYEMCFLLIERGADINYGELIHTLVRENDEVGVKFLLNNNVDLNRRDKEQRTPLHLVSLLGYDKMVKILLELGADINTVDINYQTALHLAVQEGHLKVIEALLPYGPSLKIRDKHNRTPLGEALLQKRDPVAMLLIEKGGADANEVDDSGKTLLHQAIEEDKEEDVLFLITMKINLEGRRASDYSTPLHMAAQSHRSIIVSVLLFNGADVNALDGAGMTPLNISARKGFLDIVDMIIEQRMDVNVNLPDMDGNSPLHNSILAKQPEAAKKILKHKKVDVNAKSYIGRTPLHILAEGGGDPSLVSALIFKGAEVDVPDATNNTPLHLAAFTCHDDIAVELVRNGAQICAPNKNGHTCLDNLFSSDDYEMNAFVRELQRKLIEAIPREPALLPDELTQNCQICRRDFGFATRKHHCRHCGRIVCSSCSPREVIIDKFADEFPRRVCITCYDILTTPKAQIGSAPGRRR